MKATGIVRRVDDLSQMTLEPRQSSCFALLDLAKRKGWKLQTMPKMDATYPGENRFRHQQLENFKHRRIYANTRSGTAAGIGVSKHMANQWV